MPNDLHPTSILQLLHDQTIDRDTPDIFDISARHRLAIGNDGQCLQRGTGIARGLLRVKLVQVLPHFGAALESPTRSHLHQLDPSQGPVLLKLLQEDFQCVRPQRIIKKYTQLSHSHGLRSADQGGFEDPFGIHRIHGSAIPGKFWSCADCRHHTNCKIQSRAHQEETLERRTTRRETAFGRMRPGRPSGRIVAHAPLDQRLRHIVRHWRAKLQRPP